MTSSTTMQVTYPHSLSANFTSETMLIRDVQAEDFEQIQAIYAYHVLHSTATFEEVPPSITEMRHRYDDIQQAGLPYLVAVLNEQIVGYAYAGLYRSRAAYRFTLEDSIYLARGQIGKGLGKALLKELLVRCEQGPWRQMIAVIAGLDKHESIGLHRALGFVHAGTQVATGYKFQQWIDVVFMQRALGAGNSTPPTPED